MRSWDLVDPALVEQEAAIAIASSWPAYESVQISHLYVPVTELRTAIPQVDGNRLRRNEDLASEYLAREILPFVSVHFGDRVLIPPLVERHSDLLIIVDGLHRCLAVLELKVPIVVLLIEPSRQPPAVGKPQTLGSVQVLEGPPPGAPFFADRGYENFRPGEELTLNSSKRIMVAINSRMEKGNDH